MLIVGDSFVTRLAAQLDPGWPVVCAGRSGARLADDEFRRWAIGTAAASRPERVVLMIGGNDVALPRFRHVAFLALFEELAYGLLAAGAQQVHVMALPPRVRLRAGDVPAACYRKRRHLANGKLRVKFRRAPISFLPVPSSGEFLGSDGVHPSQRGWEAIKDVIRSLL